MMHVSVSILCLFVLVGVQSAVVQNLPIQNQQLRDLQRACPTVSVSCPAEVKDGEPITFTVNVSGGNPNVVPAYNWEVSTGKIIEGQGTASIKLDMTGFGGHSPTATVTISGFDSACARTASCSMAPVDQAPVAVLFDRYYPKSQVKAAPKKPRLRRRAIRRRLISL
jgi:hypothetical protein